MRGTSDPNAEVTGDSFLKRLCEKTGLDGFDLPTESQWEIACRAGTTTYCYWADLEADFVNDYMWHSENSGNFLHSIGRKIPNAWGLYDMAGNAWELCRDGGLALDSSADVCCFWEMNGGYVLRGGSFSSDIVYGMSSFSKYGNAEYDVGFRLSRMSSKGEQSEGGGGWRKGPDFLFDTREEKTTAGTEAEAISYSGDDWGAGGSGVTVWCALDGGERNELKTATDSGTVSWTPTLNGRYLLVHAVDGGDTNEAVIVVNGLPGGDANPWKVGEGVTAYVRDRVLHLQGEGEVDEFAGGAPWAEYDELLKGAYLARKVKVPASVAATLPISVTTTLPISDEGGAPVSPGVISGAEPEAVRIIDGKAYLSVSVYASDTVTNQNWSVATNGVIEVPAPGKQGFFYLMSKPAEPLPTCIEPAHER